MTLVWVCKPRGANVYPPGIWDQLRRRKRTRSKPRKDKRLISHHGASIDTTSLHRSSRSCAGGVLWHVAMKTATPLLFALLLTSQSALAATTTGCSALALASLVGVRSPVLSRHDKSVLARLLGGHADVAFPANKQISVKASCHGDFVDVCCGSKADIASRPLCARERTLISALCPRR
jgi:hypothetical protein